MLFEELMQQTLTEGEAESRNATVFEEWPKSTAIFLKRLSGKTDILKHIANAGCAPQVKTTSWLEEKKKSLSQEEREQIGGFKNSQQQKKKSLHVAAGSNE